MCEICQNWARTDGKLTNHHPNCPRYNDSLMSVFKVSSGSSSYYTTDRQSAEEEIAMGEPGELTLTEEKMHREIFENLPEFDGF